jgi:predicted LPLAT superfamily acyltransferase
MDKRVFEKCTLSGKSREHIDNDSTTRATRPSGYSSSEVNSKISEADHWVGLPERGTSTSLQLIAWIAVHLGPGVARLLLYPITVYFLITGDAARRASYEFLKRARGRSVHWHHVFRHFHCFATTILDRLYLLRGEFDRFRVTIEGKDVLKRQMETGKGAILLGSHLGSFEVLRALGVMERSFPLKVLMDSVHNQNITRFFDQLNPTIAGTVIAPDRPDTLIRVRESLDAGYFVGILGDRVFGADKTTQCQFLGAPASFPAGPIILAALMHCPVILLFGLYRGRTRYEIYFEHFADEINLDRENRAREIQSWMQRYVARLEYYTRLAPYNWFNFYPFWGQGQSCGDLKIKISPL